MDSWLRDYCNDDEMSIFLIDFDLRWECTLMRSC